MAWISYETKIKYMNCYIKKGSTQDQAGTKDMNACQLLDNNNKEKSHEIYEGL